MYISLLEQNPGDTDTRNAYGILLLQTGEAAKAEKIFRALISENPDVIKYQANLGNVFLAADNPAEALEVFTSASGKHPDNAELMYNMAVCQMAMGDFLTAENTFLKVLELHPDHYQSQHNLGNLLSIQNRLSSSVNWLEKAAKHSSASPASAVLLVSVYERLNRLDEAEETLKGIDPAAHPMTTILKARLLRRRGQIDDA